MGFRDFHLTVAQSIQDVFHLVRQVANRRKIKHSGIPFDRMGCTKNAIQQIEVGWPLFPTPAIRFLWCPHVQRTPSKNDS